MEKTTFYKVLNSMKAIEQTNNSLRKFASTYNVNDCFRWNQTKNNHHHTKNIKPKSKGSTSEYERVRKHTGDDANIV